MVTAIICDNGEPNIEQCIRSLRNQSIPVRVVVAAGPKTNLAQAKKLADKVYVPVTGIGKARIHAIVNEKDPIMLSCDADTRYAPNFAEIAAQDLRLLNAVKAGTILPREDYPQGDLLLAWAESAWIISGFFPYEFCTAFRRSNFINAGIHQIDYDSNPRSDIGLAISRRMCAGLPIPSDPRMICWTRLPTKGAEMVRDNYFPSILGVAVPFGTLGAILGLSELAKYI